MFGTTALTVCFVIAILFNVYWIRRARYWMKRAETLGNNCEAWEAEISRISGISHNFLNACRLIAIHRNGRVNEFTFARHDKMFMIETMGILSDRPDEWRKQAGID